MKKQFTPGPWKMGKARRGYLGQDESKMESFFSVSTERPGNGPEARICNIEIGGSGYKFADGTRIHIDSEVAEANAHIIEAAPDMYKALEELLLEYEPLAQAKYGNYVFATVWKNAKDAMNKAVGK